MSYFRILYSHLAPYSLDHVVTHVSRLISLKLEFAYAPFTMLVDVAFPHTKPWRGAYLSAPSQLASTFQSTLTLVTATLAWHTEWESSHHRAIKFYCEAAVFHYVSTSVGRSRPS